MLAMIFPGQGSEAPGMQAELADRYGEIELTYREASESLGFDLWQRVQTGSAESLSETVVTQPAMLAAGVAGWRAWQKAGGSTPSYLAGHSLGEYTALVCAGSLEFGDAIRLVRRRGELMQAAVPAGEGAMAAILGLDDGTVVEICRDAAEGQVVSAVNFNSPSQVVISGHRAAVLRAAELARKAGAKRAVLLSVSVPSHCELMRPAAHALSAALADTPLAAPSIPVISNVDVRAYEEAGQIRHGLTRQLYSPVRWSDTVRYLAAQGVSLMVEAGPGKVLTRLVARIERSVAAICIDTPKALDDALALARNNHGEPDQ
ncbi:MAG: ACP S-malonyltransferase [Woeseiaceae bacterium]